MSMTKEVSYKRLDYPFSLLDQFSAAKNESDNQSAANIAREFLQEVRYIKVDEMEDEVLFQMIVDIGKLIDRDKFYEWKNSLVTQYLETLFYLAKNRWRRKKKFAGHLENNMLPIFEVMCKILEHTDHPQLIVTWCRTMYRFMFKSFILLPTVVMLLGFDKTLTNLATKNQFNEDSDETIPYYDFLSTKKNVGTYSLKLLAKFNNNNQYPLIFKLHRGMRWNELEVFVSSIPRQSRNQSIDQHLLSLVQFIRSMPTNHPLLICSAILAETRLIGQVVTHNTFQKVTPITIKKDLLELWNHTDYRVIYTAIIAYARVIHGLKTEIGEVETVITLVEDHAEEIIIEGSEEVFISLFAILAYYLAKFSVLVHDDQIKRVLTVVHRIDVEFDYPTSYHYAMFDFVKVLPRISILDEVLNKSERDQFVFRRVMLMLHNNLATKDVRKLPFGNEVEVKKEYAWNCFADIITTFVTTDPERAVDFKPWQMMFEKGFDKKSPACTLCFVRLCSLYPTSMLHFFMIHGKRMADIDIQSEEDRYECLCVLEMMSVMTEANCPRALGVILRSFNYVGETANEQIVYKRIKMIRARALRR